MLAMTVDAMVKESAVLILGDMAMLLAARHSREFAAGDVTSDENPFKFYVDKLTNHIKIKMSESSNLAGYVAGLAGDFDAADKRAVAAQSRLDAEWRKYEEVRVQVMRGKVEQPKDFRPPPPKDCRTPERRLADSLKPWRLMHASQSTHDVLRYVDRLFSDDSALRVSLNNVQTHVYDVMVSAALEGDALQDATEPRRRTEDDENETNMKKKVVAAAEEGAMDVEEVMATGFDNAAAITYMKEVSYYYVTLARFNLIDAPQHLRDNFERYVLEDPENFCRKPVHPGHLPCSSTWEKDLTMNGRPFAETLFRPLNKGVDLRLLRKHIFQIDAQCIQTEMHMHRWPLCAPSLQDAVRFALYGGPLGTIPYEDLPPRFQAEVNVEHKEMMKEWKTGNAKFGISLQERFRQVALRVMQCVDDDTISVFRGGVGIMTKHCNYSMLMAAVHLRNMKQRCNVLKVYERLVLQRNQRALESYLFPDGRQFWERTLLHVSNPRGVATAALSENMHMQAELDEAEICKNGGPRLSFFSTNEQLHVDVDKIGCLVRRERLYRKVHPTAGRIMTCDPGGDDNALTVLCQRFPALLKPFTDNMGVLRLFRVRTTLDVQYDLLRKVFNDDAELPQQQEEMIRYCLEKLKDVKDITTLEVVRTVKDMQKCTVCRETAGQAGEPMLTLACCNRTSLCGFSCASRWYADTTRGVECIMCRTELAAPRAEPAQDVAASTLAAAKPSGGLASTPGHKKKAAPSTPGHKKKAAPSTPGHKKKAAPSTPGHKKKATPSTPRKKKTFTDAEVKNFAPLHKMSVSELVTLYKNDYCKYDKLNEVKTTEHSELVVTLGNFLFQKCNWGWVACDGMEQYSGGTTKRKCLHGNKEREKHEAWHFVKNLSALKKSRKPYHCESCCL